MPITFDPVNKLIRITSPTLNVTAQELYNATMDWVDELDNFLYKPPMDAAGKFALGGGVNSDTIYRLLDGWKLKWFDGDKSVFINGTLITSDGSARTVPADSGNVETTFQVATSGTIETSDMYVSGSVNDASPTTTSFIGSSNLSTIDNTYINAVLVFTSGTLKGISRKISSYTGSTRTLNFAGTNNAWPSAPANGATFKIIGLIG